MRILVACEESQAVTIELRKLGHEAYSCDIEPCSGGHPEWHLQQDVTQLLKMKWDMIIAFPPCTYLTVTGNRWFNVSKYGDKAVERFKNREMAIKFFMMFANADCPKIAIENPVGVMSTRYRKPDQIIQPYEFGHPHSKKTCLWLKGLKPLKSTNILKMPKGGWENMQYDNNGHSLSFMTRDENGKLTSWNDPITAKIRSKTYPGIAKAMAEQWAGKVEGDDKD